MTSVLAYLILGSSGSGRREVLADIIHGGFEDSEQPLCYLSADEAPSDFDAKLGRVVRWQWDSHQGIQAPAPEGASTLFFLTNGRLNPVDQVERFRDWMKTHGIAIGRVFCVVDCRLAMERPELREWFDACIHFSDVVLLSNRKDIPNKWMSEFRDRYEAECLPCLFELVKNGRVKNPALLIDPIARRISQVFDEVEETKLEEPSLNDFRDLPGVTKDTVFIDDAEDDAFDDDEDAKFGKGGESPDEEAEEIEEDPYFARKVGGARRKPIPDITRFL